MIVSFLRHFKGDYDLLIDGQRFCAVYSVRLWKKTRWTTSYGPLDLWTYPTRKALVAAIIERAQIEGDIG